MTIEDLKRSTALGITMKDAAAVVGVDPRTISAGVKEGTIPAIRLGRRIIIPREKFLKLFEVEDD